MIIKFKGKTYVAKSPLIIYEVKPDDGIRELGTLDLIVQLEKELKQKQERRHRLRRKALIKYLMSNIQSYGIMPDPFKNAILERYNQVKHRKEQISKYPDWSDEK